MSNLFKDIYSESFYEEFSQILALTLPSFDKEKFNTLIFNDAFAELEHLLQKKLYVGIHQVSIILNGIESSRLEFELITKPPWDEIYAV